MDPRRPVDETVLNQLAASVEKAKKKIDDARWTTVMGIIMMFAGQLMVAIAVGGALMTIYGGASWAYWAYKLRVLDDQEWDAMGLPDPFDVLEKYNDDPDTGEYEPHGEVRTQRTRDKSQWDDASLLPPSRRR